MVERILTWFCRSEFLEEILGDLDEYREELQGYPGWQRPFRFWFQAFHFIRPSLVKKVVDIQKLNYLSMIAHNFTITFRGFRRHKSSFLINLIGLSTGFAAAILVFLWVNDEWQVDRFNSEDDHLYRVMANFQLSDRIVTWHYTTGRLADALSEDFPEVERATVVNNQYHVPRGVVKTPKGYVEITGHFAAENLFDVIDYKLLHGNPANALVGLKSVVISTELAEKLFGSADEALGKPLTWENRYFNETMEITGVFNPPPKNSTRQFDAIVNYQKLVARDKWAGEWNGGYAETYLVLKSDADVAVVNSKIHDYMDDKLNNEKFTLFLQKYSDYYLYGDFEDGVLQGGRIENVRLFVIIGIFILLIAGINFINLTTAQASVKLKEIGVKKALGGSRQQLTIQFLQESVTLAFLGMFVALIMVYGAIPVFNSIAGKSLVLDMLLIGPYLLVGTTLLGLLAGFYPALYLSSFGAISVLKGKLSTSGGQWVRKVLVIIQFAISVIFIVEVFVIQQQLAFMEQKPLGYNRASLLTFEGVGGAGVEIQAVRNELEKIPGVVKVGNMAGSFLWGEDSGSGYIWENDDNANYLFKSPKMGYDALETLEIKLLQGRTYDRSRKDDETKVILNESAVRMMGIEEPIGFQLGYGQGNAKREVIGVVADFQYGSMHQKIEPVLIRFRDWGRNFLIRLEPGMELTAVEKIEAIHRQFYPKYTFDGRFLDDSYKALYDTEQRIGDIAGYFALLAILISCLGLLGLATFTTTRRIKEIGIRKVLGCETWRIIYLLTSDFTKMVFIAILIGIPISYFAGNQWLENFAYSITMEWWLFVIAGLTALLIAWFTVGIQTVRAATANPAEALKDE